LKQVSAERRISLSVFVTVSNNTLVFIYGVSQNRRFLRSGEIMAEMSLREGSDKLVTRRNPMKTEI
jgi:hypothetical protein